MPIIPRKPLLSVLLLATLACSGGPSSLSTGNLSISVLGLPAGTPAAVAVTGPDGYSNSVSVTQTLSQLASGTYTLTASAVTVGSAAYTGSPVSQSVFVGPSTTTAMILYTPGAGKLALTINGLGTNGAAAVTVTGPDGYSLLVSSTTTLTGLKPGDYTISAGDVTAACSTVYVGAPDTQSATVGVSTTTSVTVTYGPQGSAPLNLCIDGLYLSQSTQTYTGSVPLVENRDGYLRVFVIASQTNSAAPAVQVRFYNGVVLLQQSTILAPGSSVPTAVDESSWSKSWNLAVPGTLIQPGLRIEAEVDPAPGVVTESSELDNVFPASGPLTMNVRTMPTVNITFVPFIQTGNGLQGDVSSPSTFLTETKKMHPLDGVNVAVHAVQPTSQALQADGTGWGEVLDDLEAIRVLEGSSRYYYGVVKVAYPSGVAGIAYVGQGSSANRVALGWDAASSRAGVAAHELGHNWGRNHAPCGGPAGVDMQYPHADGSTGVYGLDVATATLKPPTISDVMGYCDPQWIGDYTYKAVLNYLSPPSPILISSQAVQPCLLVWGHIRDGVMVLHPAFQVNTRPSLPARPGPYSVEGSSEDGTRLFTLSFAPNEIADLPGGQKNFVFAVPIAEAQASQLATLRLSGHGRETIRRAQPTLPSAVQPGAGPRPLPAELHRLSNGGARLRWDARVHPMVVVRDARTGEVLSLARDGSVQLPALRGDVDLVLSDGVKSRVTRLARP